MISVINNDVKQREEVSDAIYLFYCSHCAVKIHQKIASHYSTESTLEMNITTRSNEQDIFARGNVLQSESTSFSLRTNCNSLHLTPQNALSLLTEFTCLQQPSIHALICRYINRHIVQICQVDMVNHNGHMNNDNNINNNAINNEGRTNAEEIYSLDSGTMFRILKSCPAKRKHWYVHLLGWFVANREERREDYTKLNALLFED